MHAETHQEQRRCRPADYNLNIYVDYVTNL